MVEMQEQDASLSDTGVYEIIPGGISKLCNCSKRQTIENGFLTKASEHDLVLD